jgi:hypothetical protein
MIEVEGKQVSSFYWDLFTRSFFRKKKRKKNNLDGPKSK